MTMLSYLLIRETFDEFNLTNEKSNNSLLVNHDKKNNSNILNLDNQDKNQNYNQTDGIIENIDEKNYYVQDNEVKYKIFDEISSISKINNSIELILNIPTENNILSINKIKLSNKLNKYIEDVYLNIDDKIILKKDEIIRNNNKPTKITKSSNKENINCILGKNVNLHIILNKDALNHVINKNIFVNYSYAIFKNKLKFT